MAAIELKALQQDEHLFEKDPAGNRRIQGRELALRLGLELALRGAIVTVVG